MRVEWHKLASGRLGMKMRGFQLHLRERGLGSAGLITAGHYEVSEGHNRYCSAPSAQLDKLTNTLSRSNLADRLMSLRQAGR